ncbi:MAG: NADH-quinone oxidoreductase subunit NuoE [Pseudomonadota bacterium]|nr:NADH-quinone oxidoreductase subunit NuoE [Pseudomonadota bacterium]
MSVRRLAEDHVQPDKFAFSRAMGAEAKKWIAKYPKGRQASAVIPLLMLAQEQEGWVTRAAIEKVAGMLDMPFIRVLEVATFYTQFQLAPVGTKAHVQVCGTTPCMLRGSEALIELCKAKIHPQPFHTNEAGTLSWEEVECQGACVNAPMVMIFKDTYEDLTPERLEEIIDAFEAGEGGAIKPGPQIDRIHSAPVGGPTTLNDESAIFARPDRARRGKAEGPSVPPSKAAKPKTAAVETDKRVKSPANGKSARPAAVASLDDKHRPAAVERPAQPDDLKLISGVGPKIESILHDLGIFTWAQVAKWKKAEREWVDNYLKFKGRIEREDWVKQAKALAKGGEAEYVKVFGKKPR